VFFQDNKVIAEVELIHGYKNTTIVGASYGYWRTKDHPTEEISGIINNLSTIVFGQPWTMIYGIHGI
jgi:hypothetical protein